VTPQVILDDTIAGKRLLAACLYLYILKLVITFFETHPEPENTMLATPVHNAFSYFVCHDLSCW
jgi:hypothetical protein